MPKAVTAPLYLRRIDPERDMARFYELSVQPTLFGGASLARNWGLIGTKGRAKVETFDDDDREVEAAFARLERIKRKRGYAALAATLAPRRMGGRTLPRES